MPSSTLYPTSFKDWVLRSGTVVLKGTRGWASGITSCLIGGVEVCVANDHGRGFQSSCNADRNLGGPTDWNPTEQGSQDDSTGSATESVNTLLELSPDGTKVRTTTYGAYWFGPGDAGAAAAADTTPSPVIFRKTYTASYGGQAGLFQVLVEYIVPTKANIQAKKLWQMEVKTLYFNSAGPANMSVYEDWDYATDTYSAMPGADVLPAAPVFRSARPLISNAGGTLAGGLYCIPKSSDASGLATSGNAAGLLNRPGDYRTVDYSPTTIVNPDVQVSWNYAAGIPAGTYSMEVFMLLGTKANVQSLFTWLKANRPSP